MPVIQIRLIYEIFWEGEIEWSKQPLAYKRLTEDKEKLSRDLHYYFNY